MAAANAEPRPVWMMWVTLEHTSNGGHRLVLSVVGRERDPEEVATIGWRGRGIPTSTMRDFLADVISVYEEELVTRYGIQEELPLA